MDERWDDCPNCEDYRSQLRLLRTMYDARKVSRAQEVDRIASVLRELLITMGRESDG
jgi:hypothetical protein